MPKEQGLEAGLWGNLDWHLLGKPQVKSEVRKQKAWCLD